MIGFTIFFLILISPYFVFIRKKYNEAKDKQQFLRTNFYKSNLWILLLIFFSVMTVNLLAPSVPIKEETKRSDEDYLDSLKALRVRQAENLDFQYEYMDWYAKANHTGTRPFMLLDRDLMNYYDSLSDNGLEDISNFSKGLYFLGWRMIDSTTHYIKDLSPNLKYKNVILGDIHRLDKNDSLANHYFLAELTKENGAKKVAVKRLIDYHKPRENFDELRYILKVEGASEFFPFRLQRKIHYLVFDLISYYQVIFLHFIKDINPMGILAAFIIAITWIVYIRRLAFFQKKNDVLIIACLSMGMICAFLVFLLGDILFYSSEDLNLWNLFTWSIVGIGAIEELVKIIPLLIILLTIKRPLEAYEYILFASISAIGFAFSENLLYFDGDYGLIISGRSLTAAVGHMIDSSIFAYGLVLAKFKLKKNPIPYFFLFWFLASVTHGLYDYFLFAHVYFFFYMFFLLCARVWVAIINNSINQSQNFTYSSDFDLRGIQFYLTFSLTAILMFEYIVSGFTSGQQTGNMNLIASTISGSFLIAFLGTKLTSLNLIKGYWGVVNFSVNPFTDDIVSQNFVGSHILIKPYYTDRGLVEYTSEVQGTIISRVVLQNKERTFFMTNDDSKWFAVKLNQTIEEEGIRPEHVLIKLKDNYSSLNDQSQFMSHLLLIPENVNFKGNYPYRKELKSLGWVRISSITGSKVDKV